MYLTKLSLKNFRCFKAKSFDFSSNTTLIIGPNASGKTNILEAIYLLSTGKSFRAAKEEEMISYGEDLADIRGKVSDENELQIMVTRGEVQGKRVAKKLFKLNGAGKRWRDFISSLTAVLFRPEDIDIVLGPPSIRRHYLDSILEQVDWQYRACNLAYHKGLRQRNKLLDRIREGQAHSQQLVFWNQLIIKNGNIISQKREELIDFFNSKLKDILVFYDKSIISLERLEKYAGAELALGATLVGPHRDEIAILKSKEQRAKIERSISSYGSRGEQRMAILKLKLAELEFIFQKKGFRPILLLDDIFSELDQEHRKEIFKIIPHQQTIITATEISLVDKKLRDKIEIVSLNG